MLKIPRQQVLDRWDTLPDNLKEALSSESNSDIVWQIGALNHLTEEKISMMATIVGDVIFGFLHSEDLAREIQESLNLNSQIANSISHEINRKIFAPIRTDLEKIYSPASERPEIKSPTEPEIKLEIKAEEIKKAETPATKPTPAEIKKVIELKPAPFPTAPTIPAIPTVPAAPAIPVAPEPPIPTVPISNEKPFVLHQETEPRPVGEKSRISSSPASGWFKKPYLPIRFTETSAKWAGQKNQKCRNRQSKSN